MIQLSFGAMGAFFKSVFELGAAAALIIFMLAGGVIFARLFSVHAETGKTSVWRLVLAFVFVWASFLHGAFVTHVRYGWRYEVPLYLLETSVLSLLLILLLWMRARHEFLCWSDEITLTGEWMPQEERETGRIPRTDPSE
ncbi:MAG: hypothetical protein Q7R83_00795 [bacterium]|nr:hypothetical protein [bacterium]